MKKSNKLLLGGFLTVILLIVGIHIGLFAKYKNGNYTIYKEEDNRENERMQSFAGVSVVIVRNVGNVNVQFGASAAVEKGKEDIIDYVQKGDSLVITGRYFINEPDGRRVFISMPNNATLSADNSFLYFLNRKTETQSNPQLFLNRSQAIFLKPDSLHFLGHVKVVASDNSLAAFYGNTQVNHLEAQLSNSALEYNEGDVGELSIITDSTSRLSLKSKLLFKAKISTTTNNP